LNHAYPVKHKLKDYDMMKNFMTSGSLTRDKEDPSGRDATTFLGMEVVIMFCDGHPLPGGAACLTLVPGPRLAVVRDPGTHECKDTSFLIYIYIYI
jgi:hypothetical protein